MKIEKINDNQIRCTLTKEDFDSRHLRLSELAYGTEKAKRLFRDMMQEAQLQFGFDADNIPLMIEAIPVNSETIILIITKVEEPEELDTRFSKFSPFHKAAPEENIQLDGADNILDIFQKIVQAKKQATNAKPKENVETDHNDKSDHISSSGTQEPIISEETPDLLRLFQFPDFDTVIQASKTVSPFYNGSNSLYKDKQKSRYLLIVHQSGCSPELFNKLCNILSEYAISKPFSDAGEAHLDEHAECILADSVIQTLTTF